MFDPQKYGQWDYTFSLPFYKVLVFLVKMHYLSMLNDTPSLYSVILCLHKKKVCFFFFYPKFSQCLAYTYLVTFPAPDCILLDQDTNEPTATICHLLAPHIQPFFHLVANTFPHQEGHSSRTQSIPGTTAHFWGSQLFSLLLGPWKKSFAQGQDTETPQTEHKKQIGAGNTIPEIKPFSVWRNDWEDLPDYLPSSAYKDLNLFAISLSPWACGLWQAGMVPGRRSPVTPWSSEDNIIKGIRDTALSHDPSQQTRQ